METPPHVITLGEGYRLYWFVLLRIVESDIYYFEINRLIYTLNTFLSLILVRLSTSSQFILIMWHELFVRYVMKIYMGNNFVSDGHVCNTFCPVLQKLVDVGLKTF